MLTNRPLTRDDLPFPLDRPITGQDLLQLISTVLQPMWSAASNAYTGFVGTVRTVSSSTPKTIVVTLPDGTSVTARYLSTLTPAVGNTVVGIINPDGAIALGKLA